MRQFSISPSKIKWTVLSLFIVVGTAVSVITGTEWPPFSPYPMYSWPITEKHFHIYRVVPVGFVPPEIEKEIMSINTTRTLTSIMNNGIKRKVAAETLATGILEHYHNRLDKKFAPVVMPIRLRLEKVYFLYDDIRLNIDGVAKAQKWEQIDQIVKHESHTIYER